VGYQDRQYNEFDAGERGPVRRFFDRVFESVDNPLGWSVRMFRVKGIDARIHLFTIIFILGELVFPISYDAPGLIFMGAMMAALFLIVLLHEFGHCFACRAVGGEADRLVMLPFGGLAFTAPPHQWKAHLITTLGGPAVNVALIPVSALALVAVGAPGQILFNPFDLGSAYIALGTGGSNAMYYLRLSIFAFHAINLILLAFNVLLPFFPLDGGRIVQALLWRSKGYRRSMEAATLIGFAGAGVLAIVAIMLTQMLLLVIAIFGFWACWVERQRVRADAELAEIGAGPAATGLGASAPGSRGYDLSPPAPPAPPKPSRREVKEAKARESDAEELDRLLAKIGAGGMASLTNAERKTLDRLSKKKRES
jgi:Zn-dependent protease